MSKGMKMQATAVAEYFYGEMKLNSKQVFIVLRISEL